MNHGRARTGLDDVADDLSQESFLEKLFRQWAADIDQWTHHPLENLQLDLARTEIPHQRRDTERPERSKVDAGAFVGRHERDAIGRPRLGYADRPGSSDPTSTAAPRRCLNRCRHRGCRLGVLPRQVG